MSPEDQIIIYQGEEGGTFQMLGAWVQEKLLLEKSEHDGTLLMIFRKFAVDNFAVGIANRSLTDIR